MLTSAFEVLFGGVQPVAAGDVPAVEAVSGQDPARDIAAHAAEAVDIDRLCRIQLAQVRPELTQRDVHEALDAAAPVLARFPDVQQGDGCGIELGQVLPVEDLDLAGDDVFCRHACDVDRVLCRGVRRRIAELQITELGDGHARADRRCQHVRALVGTFGAEELPAQYLAGMPDKAMGMLTFYNAVANGGRMVELQTEGDDVIVRNEQIAEPTHIATLQNGLERAVKHGLFRKAGRSYTSVAACGRTFYSKGNNRRMELCGYFPADNPMYTIMVVLEKNGIPASAGGMCGPIMANTIDVLVDAYNLRPMLKRENEEPEEVVEVVDTVAVG